jgi:hypothetical protein
MERRVPAVIYQGFDTKDWEFQAVSCVCGYAQVGYYEDKLFSDIRSDDVF